MNPLRQKQQDYILRCLKELVPSVDHAAIYNNTIFSRLNDKQFAEWVKDLGEDKQRLAIFLPNSVKKVTTVEHCKEVAGKLGVKLFQKIWTKDMDSGRTSLSPMPRLCLYSPIRRASQTLAKKVSIPASQKVVDAASGQPTGDSKGARLSLPELRLLLSMGYEKTALELAKYRGGDLRGYAAMVAILNKNGKVSLDTLQQFASGVESKNTMKTFFTAAHLKTNL